MARPGSIKKVLRQVEFVARSEAKVNCGIVRVRTSARGLGHGHSGTTTPLLEEESGRSGTSGSALSGGVSENLIVVTSNTGN